MTPEKPSQSNSRLRIGSGVVLGLLILATGFGCARSRTSQRLGSRFFPPPMLGSRLRSQNHEDSRLAGVLGASRDQTRRRLPSPPLVQWTDPPAGNLAPNAPQSDRPALVSLPPPPALPSRTPSGASSSPTPEPTKPVVQMASQPKPAVPANDPIASGSVEAGAAAAKPKTTDDPLKTMRSLINGAKTRLDSISNYQVQMKRQERVGETLQPSEDVILSVRTKPKAVRLEWPTGPNKGREVLYSASEPSGQIHINSPGSLVPRVSLSPENPLVARSSRHPISEAGFDGILKNLDATLTRHESGPCEDQLTYQGLVTIPELGRSCHKIEQVLPSGETWVVCLDAETLLPAMVLAKTGNGDLLEDYQFRGFQENLPDLASAEAFDPDSRWGPSRGLLPRFARSLGSGAPNPANIATQ